MSTPLQPLQADLDREAVPRLFEMRLIVKSALADADRLNFDHWMLQASAALDWSIYYRWHGGLGDSFPPPDENL